jgi:hypothetical protein
MSKEITNEQREGIKKDYLLGLKPRELSLKYKCTVMQVYSIIRYHNVREQKHQIDNKKIEKLLKVEKLSNELYNAKINQLMDKSLNELDAILSNEGESKSIKIQAMRLIIDISGLKNKQKEEPEEQISEINIIHQPVKIVSSNIDTNY